MTTYKHFNYAEDDNLIVPGVKIVWLDQAWKVHRKAVVIERHESEWCVKVNEGNGALLINERHVVAIEEAAVGCNRRENFVPEAPAKTDHLPPVVAAAVFTEEEIKEQGEKSMETKTLREVFDSSNVMWEGKKVTASDGLLWIDGKDVDCLTADKIAVVNGFTCAEQIVKAMAVTEVVGPLPPVAPAKPQITADMVIAAYIKTRDEIEAEKKVYEDKVAGLKVVQEKREQWLAGEMDKLGLSNFSKKGVGTAFFKTKSSATLADVSQFTAWVMAEWETRQHFMEKRVSKTAVDQAIADGETPPPGTNYSTIRVIQINRNKG